MKRIDTVSSEATAVEVSVKGAGRGTYKTATGSTTSQATYTAEVTVFDPPDGGWQAWTVVFASALALFSSFGVVNSYGVFQSYYSNVLLPETSSAQISLIGSLQLFLIYGLGPVIGRIFDAFGTRVLVPVGSAILVVSLLLVSICQEGQPWQFFLAQGTLFGIGGALVFTPGYAVVSQWFLRYRSLALGISGAGACLGGAVTPILLQRLIPVIGFRWAVRVLAAMVFVCLSVSSALLKPRLPLTRKVRAKDIVDLNGFKDVQYTLAAIGSFLYFFVVFIPFFYIQDYGAFHNINEDLQQYLVAIMNFMGVFARVGLGLVADKLGILNVLLPCAVTCSILILALWMPSRGGIPITLFSALFGLFSGPFVSLTPAYIATRSPPERFGARIGTIFLVDAVATFAGPAVAGTFLPTVTQRNFNRLIVFTGVMILGGALCLGIAYILAIREKRMLPRESCSENTLANDISPSHVQEKIGESEKDGQDTTVVTTVSSNA